MNERMNELARQSGIAFLSSVPPDMLDKFTELIVLECAKVAYKYTDKPSNFELYSEIGWECLPGDLQDHIEKHFGVEE